MNLLHFTYYMKTYEKNQKTQLLSQNVIGATLFFFVYGVNQS